MRGGHGDRSYLIIADCGERTEPILTWAETLGTCEGRIGGGCRRRGPGAESGTRKMTDKEEDGLGLLRPSWSPSLPPRSGDRALPLGRLGRNQQ